MKERDLNVWVNAAVVFASVMALGAFQVLLPGLPLAGLKLPLVVFAGVYWMAFCGPWTGCLGAMWAGAVMDGLGGAPWGAGIALMTAMCFGARCLRDVSHTLGTVPGCGLACGCAGVLMVMWQGVLNGGVKSWGWARTLVGAAEIFFAGCVAGAAVCGALWLLDAWLGNFKAREAEVDE